MLRNSMGDTTQGRKVCCKLVAFATYRNPHVARMMPNKLLRFWWNMHQVETLLPCPPTRDIMITGYHDSKSTDVMDNMLHARMYFKIGIWNYFAYLGKVDVVPKIDDFQFFLIYLGYRILKSWKQIFVVYVRFTLRHFLKGSGSAVCYTSKTTK